MDDYKKIIKAISDKNIPAPGYFSRTKCDICEKSIDTFIGWWHKSNGDYDICHECWHDKKYKENEEKEYKFNKYPKIDCKKILNIMNLKLIVNDTTVSESPY